MDVGMAGGGGANTRTNYFPNLVMPHPTFLVDWCLHTIIFAAGHATACKRCS